jgi:hypothetical protein
MPPNLNPEDRRQRTIEELEETLRLEYEQPRPE